MTEEVTIPFRLTSEWKEAVQQAKEKGAEMAKAVWWRTGNKPDPLDIQYAVQQANTRAMDAVIEYALSFDGNAVMELALNAAESYVHELLNLWQEREQ